MPDTASIVLVKAFTYRDKYEEFSNRMHFTGLVPNDEVGWKELADTLIAIEKHVYPPAVSFVRAYGYKAGTEHSIAQIDYTIPPATVVHGDYATDTNDRGCPGDVAATVRWYTGEVNTRGKKIYCRKYLHAVFSTSADSDELSPKQSTAIQDWAALLVSGTLFGTWKYSGPQGAQLHPPEVDKYLTTRTLKRRGRRPPPP